MLRLVTIPISHYCEKARWALDRAGMPYVEERHVQGIHRIASRRAGGGGTVPVLLTPDGPIGESQDILAWVDVRTPPPQRLFPEGAVARREVDGLCRRFDETLGHAGRRLMYVHMMKERELAASINDQGVPAWEDLIVRHGWPLITRFVAHALKIRPGSEREDEYLLWREFDFAAQLLADGRPHLCGEHFGAADLTFAALSAAVVLPANYGTSLPDPAELPAPMAALVARARAHAAGSYALKLFEDHRGRPAP